jgi:hypothetical protein
MSTEFLFFSVSIAIFVGALIWLYVTKKSSISQSNDVQPAEVLTVEEPGEQLSLAHESIIEIPITKVDIELISSAWKLSEIKDHQLVERITAVIPGIAELVTKNATRVAGEIYRADIPYKDLVKSKTVKNAVKGFSRNGKSIAKNANLTKVEPSKVASAASVTSNVMNVASMIVGQYYMAEISSKLDELSRGLERIFDHQEAQLKGQLLSSIIAISEISRFQADLLEDEKLRIRKLDVLEEQKEKTRSLLLQINSLMEKRIQSTNPKKGVDGFKEYESVVHELNSLQTQQNALLSVIGEITQLEFVLEGVSGSRERSAVTLEAVVSNSKRVNEKVQAWHEWQFKALGVDLEHSRAEKSIFWSLPGAIRREWKFVAINAMTQSEIEAQANTSEVYAEPKKFEVPENVSVVVQDGKLFYAIPANESMS